MDSFASCLVRLVAAFNFESSFRVYVLARAVVSNVLAESIMRRIGRHVVSGKRTMSEIFRIAVWSTVSPTLSLLLAGRGIQVAFDKRVSAVLWLLMAGISAIIGRLGLQSALGMKLRRVKSGTLLTRVMHIARKAGVRVERVCVVPAGRGRLTNAFAGWRTVALTDNFGEYLSGAELDAVIAHELGHVQRKHTRKKLLADIGMASAATLLAILVPAHHELLRACYVATTLLALILLDRFLSRRHEYECDRKAVEFTDNVRATIRALAAVYKKNQAPADNSRMIELFMTHPSLTGRVQAIATFADLSSEECANLLAPYDLQFPEKLEDQPI